MFILLFGLLFMNVISFSRIQGLLTLIFLLAISLFLFVRKNSMANKIIQKICRKKLRRVNYFYWKRKIKASKPLGIRQKKELRQVSMNGKN